MLLDFSIKYHFWVKAKKFMQKSPIIMPHLQHSIITNVSMQEVVFEVPFPITMIMNVFNWETDQMCSFVVLSEKNIVMSFALICMLHNVERLIAYLGMPNKL